MPNLDPELKSINRIRALLAKLGLSPAQKIAVLEYVLNGEYSKKNASVPASPAA